MTESNSAAVSVEVLRTANIRPLYAVSMSAWVLCPLSAPLRQWAAFA
jgi:hypothetical protein